MWCPISIKFTNLFSHVESEHVFKQNKTTVIFGENKTDKGMQNNGSGKSTILEAICLAYTGDTSRGLNKEDFINYDYDDCEITLYLENSYSNSSLEIYRRIFRSGKSSIVRLTEDKIVNTQITSVNEANKRIIELIGITTQDFLRYFMINQDSKYNFFAASDGDKKEIMNRITSADMIIPVVNELSSRSKQFSLDLNRLNSDINTLNTKLSMIEEQIEEEESLKEIINEIKELEAEIKEITEDDKKVLEMIKNTLRRAQEADDAIKLKEKEDEKRISIKKSYDNVENEIAELEAMRRKCNSIIAGLITCPECGAEFLDSEENTVDADETRETLVSIEENIVEKNKELQKLSDKLKGFKKLQSEISDLKNESHKMKRIASNSEAEIERSNRIVERKKKQIEALKKKTVSDKLVGLKQKQSELTASIDELKLKLEPIENELSLIKYWQYYIGKSGFTTFLANKSIKLIEGVTNSFLKKFKVDISVLINGFKVLKDGSVREKIDVYIQSNGLQAKKFMANSGGERGRVILAGILGIQHLINLSTEGKGLNFIALDETFPGIDSVGQENMIKVLDTLGVTIMLITQNVSDDFNVDNFLLVEKTNGVSKYI